MTGLILKKSSLSCVLLSHNPIGDGFLKPWVVLVVEQVISCVNKPLTIPEDVPVFHEFVNKRLEALSRPLLFVATCL